MQRSYDSVLGCNQIHEALNSKKKSKIKMMGDKYEIKRKNKE